MAQLNSIFQFTGKLGNVIAYRRGGKVCLRSRPESVRQTANTRRSAQWFGAASNKGAFIRSVFADELDIPRYGAHVNQLNKTIFKAGRNNHAALKGFQFNPATGVDKFLPHRSALSRNGKLQIHPNRLEALGGAEAIEVKLIAKRIDFTTRKVTGTDVAFMVIGKDYLRKLHEPTAKRAFEGAELSVNVPGKGTLIVVMQIRLHLEHGASGNKKHCAADIIAVQDEQPQEVTPARSQPYKPLRRIPTDLSTGILRTADKVVIIQKE